MKVRKAVITAAAPTENTIPLQRLVDLNGDSKTALQLIVEETLDAGVEEICIVVRPGDQTAYEAAAGDHLGSLCFESQPDPRGYADAIHRAKDFVGDEPFLHLVGDHLYLSGSEVPCAKQLVDVAAEFECSVSAVESTHETRLPYFGVVSGVHVPRHDNVFEVNHVVEKPTPTLAEQELVTPGLRNGHYLGFFGMHVLQSNVMQIIGQMLAQDTLAKPSLSDALAVLPTHGRYLAYQVAGHRYNLGIQYGLLMSQLAIGLSGRDRDQILSELVQLLANRPEAGRTK